MFSLQVYILLSDIFTLDLFTTVAGVGLKLLLTDM